MTRPLPSNTLARYIILLLAATKRSQSSKPPELWKWSSYRATAGREKPHPSLTVDWVLGQFSGKRAKAEQEYRQFVKWGIDEKSVMLEVKGQVILGEDEFVNSLVDHLKKHKHVPEIPKSQRYANRPTLDKIFIKSILKDRKKRETRRWLRLSKNLDIGRVK